MFVIAAIQTKSLRVRPPLFASPQGAGNPPSGLVSPVARARETRLQRWTHRLRGLNYKGGTRRGFSITLVRKPGNVPQESPVVY